MWAITSQRQLGYDARTLRGQRVHILGVGGRLTTVVRGYQNSPFVYVLMCLVILGAGADLRGRPQGPVTIQGDFHDGNSGRETIETSLTGPFRRYFDETIDVSGGNVLTRWTRQYSESSDMALQLYYDRTQRDYKNLRETRDTFDFDVQHRFRLDNHQNVIWGLGDRYTGDNTDGSYTLSFTPTSRDDGLYSPFIQDEITIVQDFPNKHHPEFDDNSVRHSEIRRVS
jgi:hypothetical protein